jgi:hypothetical protein
MAYTSGNAIEAAHYNGFATSVNALWGTGTSNRGLGQSTTVASVSAGDTVSAAQWSTLLDRTRSLSDQYGTDGSITVDTVTNPSAGGTVSAFTTIAADIATVDAAAIAVAAAPAGYSSAVTNVPSQAGLFKVLLTQTNTLTFASAAAMRYFFNAGGKVEISGDLASPTLGTKATEWDNLLAACGTYQIFNTTSGKSGGSGSVTTNNTNAGFWDLSTSPTVLFKQNEDSSPYTANFWHIQATLNAAPGSSTILTIAVTWNDVAAEDAFNAASDTDNDFVDGTKTTTFSYAASNTTYISAQWGTPAWSNTVNTVS